MKVNFATIYKQDLEFISKCILDYPDIETGGDFFGFWNNLGLPVILYVTGPGENCYRHSTFFKQDLDFLIDVGNSVYSLFGLQHIGSWHSHHKLSLAVPSYHDCNTMANAISNNNLDKFFMILGNITNNGGTTINGFLFDKFNKTNYLETEWKVLDSNNIIENSINKELEKHLVYIPKTKKPILEDLKIVKGKQNEVFKLDFEPHSWLASDKGKKELKEIFSWFNMRFNDAKMFISNSKDLELKAENISILFKNDFPNSHPIINLEDEILTSENDLFEYSDYTDILEFITSKINTYISNKLISNEKNK